MTVYVGRVHNYVLDDVEAVLRESFKALSIDVARKRTAFLKPNIVMPAGPDSAVVTHPVVVEALVKVLREQGINRIIIGEGVGVGQDSSQAFGVSGFRELCQRLNLELVDLDTTERVQVEWKHGKISVPKVVLDSDIYINLPKLKTHGQTTVTLSLKNQKGLLLPSDKKNFHRTYGLHEPLVSFADAISPDLVVADGILGMDGEGPLRGRRRKVGVLVVGNSMVEVDSVCCRIVGIDPSTVNHLRLGSEAGLGSLDPETVGTPLTDVSVKFAKAHEEFGNVLNIYSWRNPYACSMCIHSFSAAIKLAVTNPRYWFTVIPKLAFYSTLGRLHIVQGKNASLPTKDGRVICLGDCTKKLSDDNSLCRVSGCPPKPEDILDKL